jgi:hypothetical protein
MSNEGEGASHTNPVGKVTTFIYDGRGSLQMQGEQPVTVCYAAGHCIDPDKPQPAAEPATRPEPLLRHAFGFRLCGSETREEALPWAGHPPGSCILAIERLRAYVTRDGQSAAPASDIGGVEVHAELQPGRIVCTAQLSDFAAGDLVVVHVDVAVFALGR